MATIAHLSDVHFGRHAPEVVAALATWLPQRKPDLVVVSGDLTQRARVEQYRQACEFLDTLEQQGLAVLAVPGNHDVPLYDIVRRFARPLHRYKKYIADELCPYWENDRLAVLGLNTARSMTFKDGSISREQLEIIRDSFSKPEEKLRVLVTHHPLFGMPVEGEQTRTARHSQDALRAAGEAGVDLLLAGHFHRSAHQLLGHEEEASEHVETMGSTLVVQAGTAASTRVRGGEPQSFNWIEAFPDGIELTVETWHGDGFRPGPPVRFAHKDQSWRVVEGEWV
jgi:3',5'-cyclic AMP phosphodiesterase CpdA